MHKYKDEILERVINHYRTTSSGRKVRWDEPDRDTDPDVISHNAAVAKQLRRKKQQAQSREKLKLTNKVPIKDGKPMWEELQMEGYSDFMSSFRKAYYSNRLMTFRKWLETIEDLVDTLD